MRFIDPTKRSGRCVNEKTKKEDIFMMTNKRNRKRYWSRNQSILVYLKKVYIYTYTVYRMT